MTNTPTNSDDKKPTLFKKPSAFNSDPHKNRGGKSGNRSGVVDNARKGKSVNVPKFKGGSGGDR